MLEKSQNKVGVAKIGQGNELVRFQKQKKVRQLENLSRKSVFLGGGVEG